MKRPIGPLGCAGCLGYVIGFVFCSAFLAGGLVMLWTMVLQPTIQILAARAWTEQPCVIVSSEVIGDETYAIDIQYDYEFQGQKYHGDRYSFITMRTSGRDAKEKVVQNHPPGAKVVCYLNPGNPQESVLNRNFVPTMWWGLLSLPFLLVGLGGYAGMFTARRRPRAMLPPEESDLLGHSGSRVQLRANVMLADTDFDDEDLEEGPGPITLKAESSRMGTFIGVLIFALIWNGVVIAFCLGRLGDWLQGRWQWMPELILVPFALVGIVIVFGVFHSFLSMFNPVPLLTLSRRLIPLGGSADLSWQFEGSTRSIRSLKITLKGSEEARYTRGTDTHTDTSVFHEETIFETSDPQEIAAGKSRVQIPTDTMHSLNAANNKIKWQIQLRGEIPKWPDVSSSFPIRVVPHE